MRIVFGIAEHAQRNNGVHHRGINRAQAVGHLEPLQHPLLRLAKRHRAQRADMHPLGPMHHAIKQQEEVPPADDLVPVPAQLQARLVAAPDEQLVDSLLRRNFLEGLFGIRDGQRHQDGARPGRDLVNVEVEPLRRKHDLRRNSRDSLIVVLTKRTEINLW